MSRERLSYIVWAYKVKVRVIYCVSACMVLEVEGTKGEKITRKTRNNKQVYEG